MGGPDVTTTDELSIVTQESPAATEASAPASPPDTAASAAEDGGGVQASGTAVEAGTQPPEAPALKSMCIWPTHASLPDNLVAAVEALEKSMGMPVWLLIQASHEGPLVHLDEQVRRAFFTQRNGLLRKGEKIALVVDSPGGQAHAAYQLATMLRRHCIDRTR